MSRFSLSMQHQTLVRLPIVDNDVGQRAAAHSTDLPLTSFHGSDQLRTAAHPCDSSGGAIARLHVDKANMQLSLLQRGTPLVSGGRMRTTTCSSGALSASGAWSPCYSLQATRPQAQSKAFIHTLLISAA